MLIWTKRAPILRGMHLCVPCGRLSGSQPSAWIWAWSRDSPRFMRRHPSHHLSPARANHPAGQDPEARLNRSTSPQQRSDQDRKPVISEQDCCSLGREAGCDGHAKVRILPTQPSIPGLREKAADSSRKARQQRAFAIWRSVLCAPISWNEDQIRRKSLTNAANIPVFGRRRAEIGFDQALRGDAKQAGKARRSSHR